MAESCGNSLSIVGDLDVIRNAHERFTSVPNSNGSEGWAAMVYEMADEQNLCHPDKLTHVPYNTRMELYEAQNGTAQLEVYFETRSWFDPDFMTVLAQVFTTSYVSLSVEAFGGGGAARYEWKDGDLCSSDHSTDFVTDGSDSWWVAVEWSDGHWEVDGETTSHEDVFRLFVDSLDETVRFFAAQHPKTPTALLAELLNDEDEVVAYTARGNKSLTAESVESAVRAKHPLPDRFDLSGFPFDILLRYLTGDESPAIP